MNHCVKMLSILLFSLFLSTSLSAQRDKDVDDALSDRSKLKNFHVGSYVGFNYFNGWQLELAPGVGYKVKDWLIAGVGLTYSYGSRFDYQAQNDKLSTSTIGPRLFVKANVYQQFYGIAEYQNLTFKAKYRDSAGNVNNNIALYCDGSSTPTTQCLNKNEHAMFLGAGYTSNFGQGVGMYTDFIIDVLYDRVHSPRSTPYTVRFGVFYTFN